MFAANKFSIENLINTSKNDKLNEINYKLKSVNTKLNKNNLLLKNKKKQLNLSKSFNKIVLSLESQALWHRFNSLNTEMIVTKNGRRMFPQLRISIAGLNPIEKYSIIIDFVCVDNKKYRYSFHQSKWIITGPGELELPSRIYVHSDSPAIGSHWMRQSVTFDKIKLTNNQLDCNGHIIVNSMHLYQPRIHIILHNEKNQTFFQQSSETFYNNKFESVIRYTYIFPETSFMAVTAYQNHRITALKIKNNPFAKGFREDKHKKTNKFVLKQ